MSALSQKSGSPFMRESIKTADVLRHVSVIIAARNNEVLFQKLQKHEEDLKARKLNSQLNHILDSSLSPMQSIKPTLKKNTTISKDQHVS